MADQLTPTEGHPGLSDGVQQIPATITVTDVPAAADARGALLRAIGREAEHVEERFAGQASAAWTASSGQLWAPGYGRRGRGRLGMVITSRAVGQLS
ncbi:hypothetical protein ACWGNM_31635 [Streptomyces sp. NPDC055796]